MKREELNVIGKECYLYRCPDSGYLLIQPVDEHDLDLLDREVDLIQTLSEKAFTLVAFKIEDWNKELSPWPAPPVFGKVPFGEGADKTLTFIKAQLLPKLRETGIDTEHLLLGGYSLAGLFALWAAYQSELFKGIAAASPSVWFPGWLDFSQSHIPQARSIYLSLGDKEEKARNPIMAQVGNAIRRQEELLREQGVNTVLEWNVGNHFVDSDLRTAKAFSWLLKQSYNC